MNQIFSSPIYILAVIAGLIIISEWLVKSTFLKLGGTALLVIILMAILTNFDLAPSGSEAPAVYGAIQKYIAPIAIFFLLLDVNLRNLKKAGMPMLLMFFIGSAGTMVGCLVGFIAVPGMMEFGKYSAPLAGMFLATYTGGGINFNAVALHYDVMQEGTLFAGAVAVDNVMTTLWILITIQGPILLNKLIPRKNKEKPSANGTPNSKEDKISFQSLAELTFWGILVLLFSDYLSTFLTSKFGITVPSILILTTIALIMAQMKRFQGLKGNQTLGLYMIYFFLATVGAYCEIPTMLGLGDLATILFGFALITIMIHGVITFGLGALLKLDWYLVAIASQANIGGQTTAMALAKSFKKDDLILPAILVGTLGNGLGTYFGFLLALMLS